MNLVDNADVRIIEEAPYQAIASIYDELMAHVEYKLWSEFIAELLRTYSVWPPKTLELACGTGKMAVLLSKLGLTINCYDKSPAMIDKARQRYSAPGLKFQEGTFSNFAIEEKFDAALCLYDSINYILELEEVVPFIERVSSALLPNGIFIFDICTRLNSRLNFRKYLDTGVIDGTAYRRFSDYNPRTHIHINEFTLYRESDTSVKWRERHEQRIYTVMQIQSALKDAGMELLGKYDDITLRAPHSRSLRIHFLTRKPG